MNGTHDFSRKQINDIVNALGDHGCYASNILKVLKLTSYDKAREDRAIWVNFDYVVFIKNRHTGTGEKIKGASIELLSGTTVDVTETAEDIVKALSVMDNKDYNREVDDV